MITAISFIVSLLAFFAMNGIYVLAQAIVGTAVGAKVEAISIGFGPVVIERLWKRFLEIQSVSLGRLYQVL